MNTKEENINSGISRLNTECKTAVSVDCVIFGYDEEDLRVLLMKSDMPPFEGMYSLLGDLVQSNENCDQSASRILSERTGLIDLFMEQVNAFSDIDRHPLGRVITVAYYSLVKLDEELLQITRDNDGLQWLRISEVDELAFDHKKILTKCTDLLRRRLRERPIGFNLLPKKFSLLQLQNLYETVLDLKLDKRNFRRKLKAIDLLIDENEIQSDVNHRPAKLYSFDQEKYENKRRTGFSFEL